MVFNTRLVISKKELKDIILYSFILFAFLKPDSLEYIGFEWMDYLLVIIDGIVMAVLVLKLIEKKFKISKCSMLIFLIYFFIGLSTVLGTQDYFSLLKVAGTSFGFAILTDYLLQHKPNVYFKSSIAVLIILFSINLVTIFAYYPTGMYEMDKISGDLYFMGHDNGMIYNLIPLCGLSLIYSYLKNKKLITWYSLISFFLLFYSEIYVRSITGIIEAVILIVLVIMYDSGFFSKIIEPLFLLIIYFILNILLVIFRVQSYFSWFIVGVLEKDITLTGRTALWDYAIMKIVQNKYMGYGMGSLIHGLNGHVYPHCHNLLLDFLYKGGIITLILFFILLFVFGKNFYKTTDKRIARLIIIPLFILLCGEVTAACPYKVYFWSFFVLIQYADKLKKIYE